MDLFIEWRADRKRDGYRDAPGEKGPLDHDSRRALKLRGQMFTFAAHLMNSQHRLSLFAVDISNETARLYRFDPSCVVISEPIFYRRDSKLLDTFFLRYSIASLLSVVMTLLSFPQLMQRRYCSTLASRNISRGQKGRTYGCILMRRNSLANQYSVCK